MDPLHSSARFYDAWDAKEKGCAREAEWNKLFMAYIQTYPELAEELMRRLEGRLPERWHEFADEFILETAERAETLATRKASQLCLSQYAKKCSELMGGSADLTGSNLTQWQGAKVFSKFNPEGQYIHFGVREFGMSAIMNGMAVYGGIIPFAGTFLTFSDYSRNAIRLAALMQAHSIFVFSHDSIGLGEDGPTHQPIEHLPSLRMIPGLTVWRPCDTVETAVAWRKAIEMKSPSCLALTRQNVPAQPRSSAALNNIQRGGYVLRECSLLPDIILIATGSEVELIQNAAVILEKEGMQVRVVSMPSTTLFLQQDAAYQESVLPHSQEARIAVEAAATDGWYRFVGNKGAVIGINHYGYSAPCQDVYKACGLTVEKIVETAYRLHERHASTEKFEC